MVIEQEPAGLQPKERAKIAVDQVLFRPLREGQPPLSNATGETVVFELNKANGPVDINLYLDDLVRRMGNGKEKSVGHNSSDLGESLANSRLDHAARHPGRRNSPRLTPYF